MQTPILDIDATWSEVSRRMAPYADMRVHVIVLPSEATPQAGPIDPRLSALETIDQRARSMHPLPDTRDYLREGRSGAMYGEADAC